MCRKWGVLEVPIRMTSRIVICILAAMLLTGCVFNDTVQDTADHTTYSRRAYIAGQADARRDIQHGVLAIEAHGLGAGYGKYAEILKQRYGIEERGVAGCGILDNKTEGHLRGYNGIPSQHFHLFIKQCEWRVNSHPVRPMQETLTRWWFK